jgi:hypothetical protein
MVKSERYTRWSILKFVDARRRPLGWRRFLAGRGRRWPPGHHFVERIKDQYGYY